jgi:hypothetical protein
MPEFRDIIAGHLEARAGMPWLTLVSGDRATPFTVRQVAERTYDYCAFYRAAGVAENDTVVIRSDAGETMPEDHVGEILIRSDCMLDSYHNNREETQRAMADGWFKTGDLGFLHHGELFVTGRSKEMLIIGGENIYDTITQLLRAAGRRVPPWPTCPIATPPAACNSPLLYWQTRAAPWQSGADENHHRGSPGRPDVLRPAGPGSDRADAPVGTEG